MADNAKRPRWVTIAAAITFGIAGGALIGLGIFALSVSWDDLQPGTWTGLIGGLAGAAVAAALGGLALVESRKANRIAELAAEIAETNRPIAITAKLDIEGRDTIDPKRTLNVTVPPNQPPLWIHGAEHAFAYLGGPTNYSTPELTPFFHHEKPPCHLATGETLVFDDPFPDASDDQLEALPSDAFARVTLRYSVAKSATIRPISIDIELPTFPHIH